jgi:MYXO-CTERM domain-containing protein
MTRGLGMRTAWVGAALLVGLGASAPAWAVIPYEDQITPGELRGIAYAPGDPWLYGYWEYLPESFEEYGPQSLPLLVFMPGVGEYDDVSSCPGGTDLCTPADCGGDGLCRNLTWGPQQLIANGQWDDVLRPFIVVSPQHPVPPGTAGPWNIDQLDDYLQFIVDNYPVDLRRVYLIGMSQGGRGTLQYTQAHPRRFTAVAPAPGGIVDADASCFFQDTALWVFHGENDADGTLGAGVFNPCNMVNVVYQYENPGLYVLSPQCLSIVGQPRPPGRLTMFDNVGHFAWVPTVDPVGNGFAASEWAVDQGCGIPATFRQYSAALDSDGVYSWFLSLDRPRVVAPDDVLVDVPEVSLPATITDDDAVTITWTQTGGPPATLAGTDTDTLEVTGLQPLQEYTFEIYVLDADDQWDLDEVVVTTDVLAPAGSSSGDASTSTSGDGTTSGSSGSPGSSSGELTRGESTGDTSAGASDTSAGVSATTGSDGPLADDTQGGPVTTDTSGNATSSDPSGPDSASDSAATSTSGGRETDDASADPDGGSGCGCRSDEPSPRAAWAWAVVLLALRRRRGRRR